MASCTTDGEFTDSTLLSNNRAGPLIVTTVWFAEAAPPEAAYEGTNHKGGSRSCRVIPRMSRLDGLQRAAPPKAGYGGTRHGRMWKLLSITTDGEGYWVYSVVVKQSWASHSHDWTACREPLRQRQDMMALKTREKVERWKLLSITTDDKRSKGQASQFFYWKTLSTNERAEWRWGRGLRNLQSKQRVSGAQRLARELDDATLTAA
ncbi:hypothetical protein J6590_070657 [Homalodisca vitripennis]|nr:hypothetical protein J6590_070657 [Homalodisca vitripennis]